MASCSFRYGSEADLEVVPGRCPGTDADPHRLAPVPARSAAPAVAGFLKRRDRALRSFIVAESDDDLVQDDLVEDLDTGERELSGEPRRLIAVSIDHVGESPATELE